MGVLMDLAQPHTGKETYLILLDFYNKTRNEARADEREKCLETHPRLREEWANKVRQADLQRIKKLIEKTATDADYKFKGKIGGVDRFADELLTQIDELK